MPLTTNRYTVKNTFEFCREINNFHHPSQLKMARFDVESLFTNVPLYETIDIVISLLFKDTDYVHNFNQAQLKELLILACTENVFLFNGTLYLQKEGRAMGGSLSTILAIISMAYHEGS